jgi:hypothetical protein
MPSSAGVSAATNQLSEIQRLMNLFLSIAQGNTNISSAALTQFLGGQGPFASSLLGMNGTEDLLAQLQQFRSGLSNPLAGFSAPPTIQDLMNRTSGPMDILGSIIGNSGQTADTQAIRQLFTSIQNGQTGPQAGVQSLADRLLGSWGMTGSMGSGLEASQALLNNGGFNAALENLSNVGGSIINQRGYGPETQGAMDFFSQIMANGGRDAGTQALFDRGAGLFDANGMTPEMRQLFSQIQPGIAAGGYTPNIESVMSQGQNLVNNAGMTPAMIDLMTRVQQGISSGGMTPEARELFGKVMERVNANGEGGALLPMNTVLNMARDSAATRANQAAEAARRSAFQRGGSALFSGTTEDVLGEFSDTAMQQEAGDIRSAALTQQELQLKQLLGSMGVGADMTKSAQGLLGQLFGTGSDLMRTAAGNIGTGAQMQLGGEDAATRRLLGLLGTGEGLMRTAGGNISTGAGLMSNAENIAAERMGQAVGGFQDTIGNTIARLNAATGMLTGAQQGANQRLGLGLNGVNDINSLAMGNQFNAAGLLSGLTNQSLQAGQGLTGLTGLEFGNAQNSLAGLASLLGLNNNMFQGQQQMALSSNAQQIDALLQSLGISSNISNSFTNNWMNASNGLTNIGQLYSSLVPSGMNSYSDLSRMLVQAQMQPGFWGQFGGNLLNGVVGGLTGGLGGLLGGIGSLFGGGRNTTRINNNSGFFGGN